VLKGNKKWHKTDNESDNIPVLKCFQKCHAVDTAVARPVFNNVTTDTNMENLYTIF
jgi:hypothetical protein